MLSSMEDLAVDPSVLPYLKVLAWWLLVRLWATDFHHEV